MSTLYQQIKDQIDSIFKKIGFNEGKSTLKVNEWKIRGIKEKPKNYWREVSFDLEVMFSYNDFEKKVMYETGENSLMWNLKQNFVIDGDINTLEADEARFKMSISLKKAYN